MKQQTAQADQKPVVRARVKVQLKQSKKDFFGCLMLAVTKLLALSKQQF
jgi:hypothetical protein